MRDGLTESTIRAHTESVPSRGIHQLAFRFPTLLHEKTDGRTHLITETQKMVTDRSTGVPTDDAPS